MHRHPVHRTTAALDWSLAEVLTAFTFPWEQSAAPLTEFRALWDDERLHFRFDCVDRDLVLADGATPRDRVLGSDRVELFLAPDLKLKPYYCLEISPRGEVASYRAEFSHEPDGSIHAGWMPWVNPGTERPDFHVPSSFGVLELIRP